MSEVYVLVGDERTEVTETRIPCGYCVKTSYFESATDKLVREDIEIKVDQEIMKMLLEGRTRLT